MIGIFPFFTNYNKHPSIKKTLKKMKPLLEKAHILV